MANRYLFFTILSLLWKIAVGVIGGAKVNTNQYTPAMATVLINNGVSDTSPFVCGGALITRRVVITCNACYNPERFPSDRTFVIVGRPRLNDYTGETYCVVLHSYVEQDYIGEHRFFGAVLLKLDRQVAIQIHVHPLVFATERDYAIEESMQSYQLIGAGYGNSGGTSLEMLQVIRVASVNMTLCKTYYPYFAKQDNMNHFWCIGWISGMKGHPVQMGVTDLGGPIVSTVNLRLYGFSVYYADPDPFNLVVYPTLMYTFRGSIRQKILSLVKAMSQDNQPH